MSEVNPPPGVVLDTCALIWFAGGDRMIRGAIDAIANAELGGGVYISPVSAWEIGMIHKMKGGRLMRFQPDPKSWFLKVLGAPSFKLAPLSPEMAIDASYLPQPLHGDPADRLLIATARHLGLPLVTRDSKILAYAELGHVQAIPC